MCTAIKYVSGDFYFGRTLDNDCSYNEEIVITPRRRGFAFKNVCETPAHYAMIGVACVMDGYPMYYDAVNEKGLGIAGLNFVGNAEYYEPCRGKDNIAVYELIPWLLGRFSTVDECRRVFKNVRLTNELFRPDVPAAQLHWMLADRNECIVIESTASGLEVYDNPVGVMTNNPTFPEQMTHLTNFKHLSPRPPRNEFSDKIKLECYSRGMGAMGLPGDLSSESRFVRAAFTVLNSPCLHDNISSVNQFFHILGSVDQPCGSCMLENGKYETTIYTSCCNATRGVYYYTCCGNHRISAVDMHKANLDGTALIRFPLNRTEQINYQN